VPEAPKPLNGENHPLSDGMFTEVPAKWTGNGSKMTKPDKNDWYETVKVNYGSVGRFKRFSRASSWVCYTKSLHQHFEFWKGKNVDSWKKFKDIALFWTAKGVDGFRYDMAEMVPYEFWSYMNSAIKAK
jgi:glycosidase